MIRRILVAVDGSVRASAVLSAAASVSEAFRATLHLLRVVTIPPDFPAAAAGDGDHLPAFLSRQALDALAALVSAEPRAREAHMLVRQGAQPWRTILEVADERDADLIILGSHGYDMIDRILGTTTGRVANMSRRHVLVVHNSGTQG